jgi:large subunit ribosomal protein L24
MVAAAKKQKFKIKKGDQVIVTTGKDKGRTGEVIEVRPTEARVKVQGINMVKRHRRPTQTNPGGIEQIEAPIHISNVSLIDPETNKPTRVGYSMEKGKKVRIARKSGKAIG